MTNLERLKRKVKHLAKTCCGKSNYERGQRNAFRQVYGYINDALECDDKCVSNLERAYREICDAKIALRTELDESEGERYGKIYVTIETLESIQSGVYRLLKAKEEEDS